MFEDASEFESHRNVAGCSICTGGSRAGAQRGGTGRGPGDVVTVKVGGATTSAD